MKVTAIVPMRHNSERVKNKNFKLFSGKPLFYYIIETLLATESVGKVVVDTDSETIEEACEKDFPKVIVLRRPDHLIDGNIPMNEVLINAVDQLPGEHFLQTHSTNPLLTIDSVERAVKNYFDKLDEFDSLFSVTKIQTRFWNIDGTAVNHDPKVLLRTQDLDPIYEENSCIYIFQKAVLKHTKNRIGNKPQLFSIAQQESIDIDIEFDFIMAEVLHKLRDEKKL